MYPTKAELEHSFYAPNDPKARWARARLNAHAHAEKADRLALKLAEAGQIDPASTPTKAEQERAAFETRRLFPGSRMDRAPEAYSEAAAIVAKVNAYADTTRRLTRLREEHQAAEQACATAISSANTFDAQLQREAAVAALNATAQEAKEAALRAEYAPLVSDGQALNSPGPTSHGSNTYVPKCLGGDPSVGR